MMDLFDVRVFARIAELGSLSGSARALGAPKSSVSRSLVRLETALGSTLVERSTRHLRLTDAGRLFLPHALRILDDVEEAEATLGQFAGAPRGTLRVRAPYAFMLGVLTPMLPAFLKRHPEVDVIFEPDAGGSDLVAGEADLIVRVGPLPDTTMIARRLATIELWTCASPSYVAARGSPSQPADLAGHDIVSLSGPQSSWSFRDAGGRMEEVKLRVRLVVPDPALIQGILAAGAGIGQLPDYMAADAIRRGDLLRVLSQAGAATSDAFALYPSHRSLSAKVRVFIDALVIQVAAGRSAFARSAPSVPGRPGTPPAAAAPSERAGGVLAAGGGPGARLAFPARADGVAWAEEPDSGTEQTSSPR